MPGQSQAARYLAHATAVAASVFATSSFTSSSVSSFTSLSSLRGRFSAFCVSFIAVRLNVKIMTAFIFSPLELYSPSNAFSRSPRSRFSRWVQQVRCLLW